MKSHLLVVLGLISGVAMAATPSRAQVVTRETAEGITNFHRLETTVACTGAIKATAVPEIKKYGFASIINLRQATEPGADLELEAAAAKSADIRYYSIPFNGNVPIPRRLTNLWRRSPKRAAIRHSSIAPAGDARPPCGLSSAWWLALLLRQSPQHLQQSWIIPLAVAQVREFCSQQLAGGEMEHAAKGGAGGLDRQVDVE